MPIDFEKYRETKNPPLPTSKYVEERGFSKYSDGRMGFSKYLDDQLDGKQDPVHKEIITQDNNNNTNHNFYHFDLSVILVVALVCVTAIICTFITCRSKKPTQPMREL